MSEIIQAETPIDTNASYPEIGDAKFRYALWAFKQQLALKNVSTLWNFYCSPVSVFVLWLSGYEGAIFLSHNVLSHMLHLALSNYFEIIWGTRSKYQFESYH